MQACAKGWCQVSCHNTYIALNKMEKIIPNNELIMVLKTAVASYKCLSEYFSRYGRDLS
jgi:hypothetical protein